LALLGCYAAQIGNYLPTFMDDICPETAVTNHQSTLRNNPKERRSHVDRNGSLKLRTFASCSGGQQFLNVWLTASIKTSHLPAGYLRWLRSTHKTNNNSFPGRN